MKKITLLSIPIICIFLFTSSITTTKIEWQQIDDGLHYTEYDSPIKSSYGDNKICILKIDPSKYKFNIYSSKEKSEKRRTAKQWGDDKNLIAVINAGMYRSDHATNLGYMKNFNFTNNKTLNKDKAIAAFNRKDNSVPEFQIIDLQCQKWEQLKDKYNSYTQSIRMVDCNQKNKWAQQPKKWSMVLIGKDKDGNALFIFSRSPYSVHNLISILLKSSINLYNAMYLEGGPEASFYLNHNGIVKEKMGSYETGFLEDDKNNAFWRVPNVIGITKK